MGETSHPPNGGLFPTGENVTPTVGVLPPRGRPIYSPQGESLPPRGRSSDSPRGSRAEPPTPKAASRSENDHTPHGGVLPLLVISSYSAPWEIIILPLGRNHHTPHRGSRSPLEEIILFTPHRGIGSLPTGGDYHAPNKGGAFHHRGSPPPPGETIDSPTGSLFPTG